MTNLAETFKERFDDLEREVNRALDEGRRKFKYKLKKGKAVFEDSAKRRHEEIRRSLARSLSDARMRNLIAAPFIYAVFFPILALDIFVVIYQAICFRLWGIPRVKRAEYVIIDRHRLPYLNAIQKLNCIYCGYANGVIAFVAEIASRTEQYWCPIKHAAPALHAHSRYYDFLDYGDGEDLMPRIGGLRKSLCTDCGAKKGAADRPRACEGLAGGSQEGRREFDPGQS
ncbi:hypothetical protein [Hyphococcus sp.]|jgi:hypothetical protein|uniref:hypothetical protein n=1 Tax=Hyphococcus sp. TaxID=2038636 RepID=UPI003D0F9C7A